MPEPYLYPAPDVTAIAIEAQEENAQAEIQRVEAQLVTVPHDVAVAREAGVWPAIEQAIAGCGADLIVLGTHGRTGAQKLLLGSVAEEILRRSRVAVLTIGPWAHNGIHGGAQFRNVLFATDFSQDSLAAVPYAISFAQEHQARLILLHVIRTCDSKLDFRERERSAAETMHELHALIPKDAKLWCLTEAVVEYGEAAGRILGAAKECNADLIVIGVRSAAVNLGTATHLERSVAHKIVAHAHCPVLTVRA